MQKVVIASSNAGKINDFKALFSHTSFEVIPQSHFNVPEIQEIGLTFIENAILKARNACQHTKLPAIGDDTGLEIDALDGRPGIYSARYAGENVKFAANIEKILSELKGIEPSKRTARFYTVMVYLRHAEDPRPIIGQGIWEGRILDEPIGEHGFGYMPIFYVESEQCSAAQLLLERKNQLSHRFQAMQQLLQELKQ